MKEEKMVALWRRNQGFFLPLHSITLEPPNTHAGFNEQVCMYQMLFIHSSLMDIWVAPTSCLLCTLLHERWYANPTFNSLRYIAELGYWILQQFYFLFFQEPPYCFPQWLLHFTDSPVTHKGFNFSISALILAIFWILF